MTSLPPAEGRVTQLDAPSRQENLQACAFPISPAPAGISWLAWTLYSHLVSPVQDTLGPFSYSVRCQRVWPSSSYIANNHTRPTCRLCKLNAFQSTCTHEEVLHEQRDTSLDLFKKAQANLESESADFFDAPLCCSVFTAGLCPWSPLSFFFFFFFKWPHPWHMEVPGSGIESKLQLQPMLHLLQHWILNPLHQAGDRTRLHSNLSHRSLILNPSHHSRNSWSPLFLSLICGPSCRKRTGVATIPCLSPSCVFWE